MTDEVQRSANYIKSGGVILYPTDTIWGIGCDARNPDAVNRIYQIKQRSDSNSMLVVMNDFGMLGDFLKQVPEQARRIMDSATKPTTIIYPYAKHLAKNLLAEDGSIGIRLTSDPFCRQLIKLTGLPIVSTSANISGLPSPTLFSEISTAIKEQVDYVVNWRQEEQEPASPSAIIKLGNKGDITVIRP